MLFMIYCCIHDVNTIHCMAIPNVLFNMCLIPHDVCASIYIYGILWPSLVNDVLFAFIQYIS